MDGRDGVRADGHLSLSVCTVLFPFFFGDRAFGEIGSTL